MIRVWVFSLFFLTSNSAISAVNKCQKMDLRNSYSAPVRIQYFKSANGIGAQATHGEADSFWCYAFTLANLVGQILGVPISPEDIAIQYYLGNDDYSVSHGGSSQLRGLTADHILSMHNGNIQVAEIIMRPIGYCRAENFSKLTQTRGTGIDWFSNLNEIAKRMSVEEFRQLVNVTCGKRIKLSPRLTLKTERVSNRAINVHQALSHGHFVGLNYMSHYVTIVGQRSNCDYVIQNSVPDWSCHFNPYVEWPWRTNGFFNYWTHYDLQTFGLVSYFQGPTYPVHKER